MDNKHQSIEETINALSNKEIEITPEILTHNELLNLDIPPMRWVMNMMIPNPGLTVISGRPEAYKTFFAQWLGMRASGGLPLFDEFDEPYFCQENSAESMGKVPTLFIEEENSKQMMKNRTNALKVFEVGAMHYMIDNRFQFTNEAWREVIIKFIEEKGIKLLILDPFSSVMGLSNENDNSEVSKVMDIIRKEFVNLGVSVILIHHPAKGGADGNNIRGAGDILGKCDVHLCLEKKNADEKIIRVTYEKLRVADRSKVANFEMRLTGDGDLRQLHFRYIGQAASKPQEERNQLAEQIMEAIDDGEEREQKEISELVDQKPQNKKFRGAWDQLIKEKKLLKDAVTKKYHKDLTIGGSNPF